MVFRSTPQGDTPGSAIDHALREHTVEIALGAEHPAVRAAEVRFSGTKPLMRGWLDVAASLAAVPASASLIAFAQSGTSTLAATIYGTSLFLLFAVSASYHTPMWAPRTRAIWRTVDHSMIYVLIAGTYTPFCLAVFSAQLGVPLLIAIWVAAAAGWLKSFLWLNAPRILNTLIYIVLGWLAIPFFPELYHGLNASRFAVLIGGGLLYSLGGVIYARRYPNPIPTVFGYHEVFHLFVVGGAVCHFWVIWGLLI